MKVFLTDTFKKTTSEFTESQIVSLEQTIEYVQQNPLIGDLKSGDLARVRVLKFNIANLPYWLAYLYELKNNEFAITLLAVIPYKNQSKNLKILKTIIQNHLI